MLTPITRMYERYRAESEDSDVSAFYSLMFLGELVTKVTVCSVLSGVVDDRDRNRYSLQHGLVRADGIGDWANVLDRALTGPSAQFLREEFKELQQELLQRTVQDAWQYEAIKLLHETLVALQVDVDKLPTNAPLRQWFKWFALLRNKTRGHGATLAVECSRAAPLLDRSINIIVENLCVLKWEWAYLHRNLSGKYRITSLSEGAEKFSYLKQTKKESLPDGVYTFNGSPFHIELLESLRFIFPAACGVEFVDERIYS